MPRYDTAYERRALRASQQGAIDVKTFIEDMMAGGTSAERVEEMLLLDLEEDGPIFGKYMRSLTGAATTAVMTAERQGGTVGSLTEDQELQRLIGYADADDALLAIENADPEILEAIEADIAPLKEFTSIADMIKTCHICLPLHGTSRTMSEWSDLGLLPEQRHSGWLSDCQCDLVPTDEVESRNDLIAPLIRTRVKSVTGLEGQKKTQRAVAQRDLDKAIAAVKEAQKSKEGRRTLRLMGQVTQVTEIKEDE